jgi:molecular chaperone IbpA
MTRFDFSPLFRSTVGFDHLYRLLDTAADLSDAAVSYPPYNIETLDEQRYRVTMAVAGFGPEDLTVECHENTLSVTGETGNEDDQRSYLYRGIAGRAFKRTFQLADYVKVEGARLENGLLQIDLVRELPKEMRPRRIEIETSAPLKIARKAKKLVERVSKAA